MELIHTKIIALIIITRSNHKLA